MKTDLQLTPNFNLKEFLHNGSDEELTPTIIENLRGLAQALEKVRTMMGNRPITINSGFRTYQHNKEVGGAPHSQHLVGRAADITVEGVAPKVVQEILKDWDGGLGSYSTWTHIDTWNKRRWEGS